uniref:Uncharacterized protein n=1 Tax=Glossina palpalis gambiensis TaxID=67801 RepID=A0A1B0BD79_9MUSC
MNSVSVGTKVKYNARTHTHSRTHTIEVYTKYSSNARTHAGNVLHGVKTMMDTANAPSNERLDVFTKLFIQPLRCPLLRNHINRCSVKNATARLEDTLTISMKSSEHFMFSSVCPKFSLRYRDCRVWQYVTFESNPRLDQKSTTLTIASFTLLTMTVNTNRIENSNRMTIEWKVERTDDETAWTYHGMNQRMYGLGNK